MPDRTIIATAPIRVCDIGGWTDTWFAGRGAVFNIAVAPRVEVRLTVRPRAVGAPPAIVDARDLGERCPFTPGRRPWGRFALVEAAIESAGIPADSAIEVAVSSGVPPGASTGTSAAVVVAVLGALGRLHGQDARPAEVAAAAHRVETDLLGRQSGVQDQLACALGGINFITVDPYPRAEVAALPVSDSLRAALDRRLILVCLGRGHESTRAHEAVIARFAAGDGPIRALDQLRRAATAARDAVVSEDLDALGAAMRANTEAQRGLHESLVSREAWRVAEVARDHGALGWKVNGAGGEGGSLTVLCGPGEGAPLATAAAIASAVPGSHAVPIRLSRDGLLVAEP